MWSKFKTLDPLLYVIPLILMGVSLVMIYTLTNDTAGITTALHQALFAVIGVVLMVLATMLDYRNLRGWIPWLYGIGVLLLAIVQIRGQTAFGAARWVNLGFFPTATRGNIQVYLDCCLGSAPEPVASSYYNQTIPLGLAASCRASDCDPSST